LGYSIQFGVRFFLIQSLSSWCLNFWNCVAILMRDQRFTLAGSTHSGSVKCFRISSHNKFFTESGTTCGLSTFPSILCSWWARCPLQWPHTVTHTCPWFFWSKWLAIIWYFCDLIHDMADEYLCTPSLYLFWCGGWSLHVADSLFN
jgi:hypothetical protein